MNDQVTVSREKLRQVLDALDGQEASPSEWDAYYKLREALEQPMQEPVAWMTFDGEGGYELRLYEANESYRDDFIRRNGERYADWVTPLYAAPQAQEKS